MNPFYLIPSDTVQVAIVFAAIVDSERVVIGEEHTTNTNGCAVAAAMKEELTWPRDAESRCAKARQLLKSGDAGVVEDVLRADNE